jgi:hypothetical protein
MAITKLSNKFAGFNLAGYLNPLNFALIRRFITNSLSEIQGLPLRKWSIIEHLKVLQEVYELTLKYIWGVDDTRKAGTIAPFSCQVYCSPCDQRHTNISLNFFYDRNGKVGLINVDVENINAYRREYGNKGKLFLRKLILKRCEKE